MKGRKMHESRNPRELMGLATKTVAAFVGNNRVAMADLPSLITGVFTTLRAAGVAEPEPVVEVLTPAVPIRKSVSAEFIVCLEDGLKLKMLKRHLAVRYGMTPDEYRRRWGLSASYPMVAPAYAEQRSLLAKRFGLGRKHAVEVLPAEPEPAAAPEPKRPVRGRRKVA